MPYRVTGGSIDMGEGDETTSPATPTPLAEARPMAEMFQSFPSVGAPIGAESRIASTYLDAAKKSIGVPSAVRPAMSGDSIASRYGTASILSGRDYAEKMRRKLRAGGFDDSLYG